MDGISENSVWLPFNTEDCIPNHPLYGNVVNLKENILFPENITTKEKNKKKRKKTTIPNLVDVDSLFKVDDSDSDMGLEETRKEEFGSEGDSEEDGFGFEEEEDFVKILSKTPFKTEIEMEVRSRSRQLCFVVPCCYFNPNSTNWVDIDTKKNTGESSYPESRKAMFLLYLFLFLLKEKPAWCFPGKKHDCFETDIQKFEFDLNNLEGGEGAGEGEEDEADTETLGADTESNFSGPSRKKRKISKEKGKKKEKKKKEEKDDDDDLDDGTYEEDVPLGEDEVMNENIGSVYKSRARGLKDSYTFYMKSEKDDFCVSSAIPRFEFDILPDWEQANENSFKFSCPLAYVIVIRILDPRINLVRGFNKIIKLNQKAAESRITKSTGSKGFTKTLASDQVKIQNPNVKDDPFEFDPQNYVDELSVVCLFMQTLMLVKAEDLNDYHQKDILIKRGWGNGKKFDPCVLFSLERLIKEEYKEQRVKNLVKMLDFNYLRKDSKKLAVSLEERIRRKFFHKKTVVFYSQGEREIENTLEGMNLNNNPNQNPQARSGASFEERPKKLFDLVYYTYPNTSIRYNLSWVSPKVFINSVFPHVIDTKLAKDRKYVHRDETPTNETPFPLVKSSASKAVETEIETEIRKTGVRKSTKNKINWIEDYLHDLYNKGLKGIKGDLRITDTQRLRDDIFMKWEAQWKTSGISHPPECYAVINWIEEQKTFSSDFSLFPKLSSFDLPFNIDPGMSLLSNYISMTYLAYEELLDVSYAHDPLFKIMHGVLFPYTLRFDDGLNPGWVLYGGSQNSKSFTMNQLECMFIPGTVTKEDGRTEQADYTHVNQDMQIVLQHEADDIMFKDNHGNSEGHAKLKTRMTEKKSTRKVLVIYEDGSRGVDKIDTSHRSSYIVGMNNGLNQISDSVQTRFKMMHYIDLVRKNHTKSDKEVKSTISDDQKKKQKESFFFLNMLMQAFQMLVGIFCWIGVLRFEWGENMYVWDTIWSRFSTEYTAHNPGYQFDSREVKRMKHSCYDLMLKRVYLSICIGANKNIKPNERFKLSALRKLSPYLYCCEEECYQAISMHADFLQNKAQKPFFKVLVEVLGLTFDQKEKKYNQNKSSLFHVSSLDGTSKINPNWYDLTSSGFFPKDVQRKNGKVVWGSVCGRILKRIHDLGYVDISAEDVEKILSGYEKTNYKYQYKKKEKMANMFFKQANNTTSRNTQRGSRGAAFAPGFNLNNTEKTNAYSDRHPEQHNNPQEEGEEEESNGFDALQEEPFYSKDKVDTIITYDSTQRVWLLNVEYFERQLDLVNLKDERNPIVVFIEKYMPYKNMGAKRIALAGFPIMYNIKNPDGFMHPHILQTVDLKVTEETSMLDLKQSNNKAVPQVFTTKRWVGIEAADYNKKFLPRLNETIEKKYLNPIWEISERREENYIPNADCFFKGLFKNGYFKSSLTTKQDPYPECIVKAYEKRDTSYEELLKNPEEQMDYDDLIDETKFTSKTISMDKTHWRGIPLHTIKEEEEEEGEEENDDEDEDIVMKL